MAGKLLVMYVFLLVAFVSSFCFLFFAKRKKFIFMRERRKVIVFWGNPFFQYFCHSNKKSWKMKGKG
jgi:hypothetical protein